MKSILRALLAGSLVLGLAACSENTDEPVAENPMLSEPVPEGLIRGRVLETMDASGYTYVLIDLGDEQRWIAGPRSTVAIGDIVQTTQGTPMGAFTSETLDRTFDNLYFVPVLGNLSAPELPPGHPPTQATAAEADVVDVSVSAVEEGKDIAWVYASKDALAGERVSLRGKVVKYNAGILGWNFIHIQDGSGSAADGSNDLAVMSHDETAVGETIVVIGNVTLNKDLGAGYSFPVIMEDAEISTE